MPAPREVVSDGKCPQCRNEKYAFTAVRSLGFYDKEVRLAVLKIKHDTWEHLAIACGRRMATLLGDEPFPERPELIAPIPMHWLKRLMRGTSAAETLARSLASAVQLPLAADLLHCRKYTQTQSSLTGPERKQNVKGAFAASRSYDVSGARILLVDDVITTGATCDSAANALLKAGAAAVYGISLARGTGMRD